jgi:hypothetical protein
VRRLSIGFRFLLRHHLYELMDNRRKGQIEDLKSFMEAQRKNATIAQLEEEVNEAYLIKHSGDYLELYVDNGVLVPRNPSGGGGRGCGESARLREPQD